MTTDTVVATAAVKVLRAAVADRIAMSFAPLRHRTMVLVELATADGPTGYGESWMNFPAWGYVERVATLRDGVLPKVLGVNADDVAAVQRRLQLEFGAVARQWGAPGPISQAISGVDVALWDLRSRSQGTPIHQLLGGSVRNSIPVYASSFGPTDVAAQARQCVADGFRMVKLKVGFGRETDEANLAVTREVIGSDASLYVDANQAWTVDEAIGMAPLLARYGVDLVEEPIRGDRLTDLETLYSKTGLAIATGENIYGLDEFKRYIDSPAVAVVQPDIAKAGGLTEASAICEYAQQHDKRVMPHLYSGAIAFLAALQLAAAAPAVAAVEYDVRDNPLRDPLLIDPCRPVDGRISIPDGPGLGLELDQDAIRSYTITATDLRSDGRSAS